MSRDNARTPMQWSSAANSGFTTGTPWLALNPNYEAINAENQINDKDSVLSFYKQLVSLRKSEKYRNTLVYGEMEPYLASQRNLFAYKRTVEKTLLVVGNFQNRPQEMDLRNVNRKSRKPDTSLPDISDIVINNYPDAKLADGILYLKPYQFVIIECGF